MEIEFKPGFNKLIRLMAKSIGHAEYFPITQTWTRNAIKNDLETAQIAEASLGIISNKTILKNHPWVEDVEEELKQLKQEEQEEEEKSNDYKNAFNDSKGVSEDEE